MDNSIEQRDKELMEDTLFVNLECEYLVAQYALLMTNYQSVEAAIEFIFGTDDSGFYQHPFVGYVDGEYNANDVELGKQTEECFICRGTREQHAVQEKRQTLDEEEHKLIEEFEMPDGEEFDLPDFESPLNLTKRRSTVLSLQKKFSGQAELLSASQVVDSPV